MVSITVEDITALFRPLTPQETERAQALIPVVCDTLEQEARNRGRDIMKMVSNGDLSMNVLRGVIVDIVARALMTSTNSEPMTQRSESGMGYSMSGSFLNPGGGLFIKNSELARLGIKRQRIGVIDPWGC